jgi:hypothetical protein
MRIIHKKQGVDSIMKIHKKHKVIIEGGKPCFGSWCYNQVAPQNFQPIVPAPVPVPVPIVNDMPVNTPSYIRSLNQLLTYIHQYFITYQNTLTLLNERRLNPDKLTLVKSAFEYGDLDINILLNTDINNPENNIRFGRPTPEFQLLRDTINNWLEENYPDEEEKN